MSLHKDVNVFHLPLQLNVLSGEEQHILDWSGHSTSLVCGKVSQ